MFQRSVEHVAPGAVLGRTIHGSDGAPLLRAGTMLTDRYLGLLRQRGYTTIYVRDGLTDDVVPDSLVSERVRSTLSDHVATTFSRVSMVATERGVGAEGIESVIAHLGEQPLSADDGGDMMAQLYADVELLITELLENDTVAGLESLRSHNEYTFQHSVDVAIIGVLLGKQLRLPRPRLRELALGCLLHDLGKIYLDQAILDKPGKLTDAEFELVKEHPRMGFELIRRLPVASLLPAHVAYQHHERQNGMGYPRGLTSRNSIDGRLVEEAIGKGQMLLVAEIGAVADVYSALSADRPYRAALPPDEITETLAGMAGSHLNAELVRRLRWLVPSYPVGHWIEVSGGAFTGWRGVVTDLHLLDLERPSIRLVLDAHGEAVADPVELDLRTQVALDIRCLGRHEAPTRDTADVA